MTIEDKEVLAQYMGWKWESEERDGPYKIMDGYWYNDEYEEENITVYQESWDAAMKIYEKIVDWCDEQDEPQELSAITEALCNPDIESFVEAMVEWIKEYNRTSNTMDK